MRRVRTSLGVIETSRTASVLSHIFLSGASWPRWADGTCAIPWTTSLFQRRHPLAREEYCVKLTCRGGYVTRRPLQPAGLTEIYNAPGVFGGCQYGSSERLARARFQIHSTRTEWIPSPSCFGWDNHLFGFIGYSKDESEVERLWRRTCNDENLANLY